MVLFLSILSQSVLPILSNATMESNVYGANGAAIVSVCIFRSTHVLRSYFENETVSRNSERLLGADTDVIWA